MPVDRNNIGEVVLNAWKHARHAPIEPGNDKNSNWRRSRKWVDSLARQFTRYYPREKYRVFWAGNGDNQAEFGINELLFDVAVCDVSATRSLERHPRDLSFIAQCHWQIESEFSLQNTRDIVVDMSKLVMGAADNKLFVAAHRSRGERDVLGQCAPIAACCDGPVYFCFVSHPKNWTDNAPLPVLHEWVAGVWKEIVLQQAA